MTATRASERHPAKWAVVCLLSLGMVIAYVDRTNLSFVLALPSFRDAFSSHGYRSRPAELRGFFWSYALLQIPAGWLVDRYGSNLLSIPLDSSSGV